MTIQNQKPIEPIISRTDIGYTIVKQRFGSDVDYDLAKVGGWSRLAAAAANTATYSEIMYNRDDRIFTWSGLSHNTDYTVSLTYLDDFILGNSSLIQAQYLQAENSLDLKHTNIKTKDPVTITGITNEVDSGVVASPFSDLVFSFTGEADSIRIQVQKVGTSTWSTIYEGKPTPGLKVSVAGGTYNLRYVSIIGFSDGTQEEFPAKTYPGEITADSGLGAPVQVSGLSLSSYKTAGSTASYDLRISWTYPTDQANQNKKRNFTVTVVQNPTSSTDYANLPWSTASEEIAITSPYSIKPFPYKTAYVIRIGVMGWGTEVSEYVYAPVYLSKDTNDSGQLGYLVPSDAEAPVTTKIQIDDEHIRAYSVFNPNNPSLNKLMFEVDAATGNVIIGRSGGAYNNTAITTAPFIFDSQNNKLQISGRVITDQIESASYVLTWIDGESPSLRTAGKNGYASGAPGIWMGYANATNFMFDLGNATNYIRWDGSDLTISGTVRIGNDGRTLGQAQKQVFIYKRSSTGVPATPTGGTYLAPAPAGWSTTVPTGSDELYMSSRLLTSDGMPPQESVWASPSLFQPGSSGTATTYTWIKYADTITGTGLSDDPTDKVFIGIAVNKMSATESTNPADYTWSRLTGTSGVPGTPGANGQTLYTWIKYSPNANGNPMTDAPDATTQYIGVAPNQVTDLEGTDYTVYTWSKFKGDQGVAGINNFKSTVFVRQDSAPTTPTGGTYASPIPTAGGWSDGIPAGNSTLWASTRIFAADNASPPHQATWSSPVAMTSTSEIEIKYSTLTGNPGDPSGSPTNWTNSASESTVWMAQRTRTNNTWSAWNVTRIKGEEGVSGSDGEDGKVLTLSSTTQTITFNAQDVMTPAGQTVTFTVSRTPNILGSTSWVAVDDSGNIVAISGTNTSASLNGSLWASRKSIRVTASADGLSDTLSVAKVRDGADAVVAVLSNESHGVPANKDGVVSSFVGADGYMKVYRGSTEITGSCTFAVSTSNGATGSISAAGYYSVTALSSDVGTLTLRAVVTATGTVLDKIFTVTKVKAGVVGARGAGQYSAVYTNPVKPITSGMAAAAKAACPGGLPVIGDIVTLYDSDPTIVPVPITYNGGADPLLVTSWDLFTVVIDGHLLVNGTVGADKININELYSKNAIISGQLQVGSGSTYTIIDGVVGGLSSFVGGTTIFSATPGGGYLNGNSLGAGTVSKTSLSPELQQWIAEVGSGGATFEFGGSDSVSGTSLASATYTLNSINFAAGPVALNFSYGGNNRTVISATQPTAGWITLQFKRDGVNFGAPVTFTGTVDGLSTNEWYCTMPSINYSASPNIVQGAAQLGIQITVVMPTGWATPPLGAFTFGVFQQPSGAGVTNMYLNDLLDVELASVTNGQTLIFDSATGKWVNGAASGGGGGATLTFGNYLTGGSYNGSSAVTVGVSASTSGTSNLVARDSSGNFSAGTITASLNGNATSATTATSAAQLTTSRSIQATGDISWSTSFNGSASVSGTATLANSGVVASTYGSSTQIPVLTVDSKGRITGATTASLSIGSPTSISNNGTSLTLSTNGAILQTSLSHSYLYFNSGTYGTIYGTSSGVTIQGTNQSSNVATFQTGAISLNTTTTVSGTITATDCIATSDIRVKENLVRIDKPIERLKKLNGGYTFDRTDMDNIRHAGVIANYVKEALPEAIFVGKESDLLTVSHSGMLGLLVEVCTEQQKRIEELERRLNGNS